MYGSGKGIIQSITHPETLGGGGDLLSPPLRKSRGGLEGEHWVTSQNMTKKESSVVIYKELVYCTVVSLLGLRC